MSSIAEILVGVVVEVGVALCVCVVIYRLFAGRFLIPKREAVLLYQRGVLVSAKREPIVVGPGSWWVRPGMKLLLCDVRPRTLQIERYEVVCSDGVVMRLSVVGEYKVSNPAVFICASANASDTFFFEVRRSITTISGSWPSTAMMARGGADLLAQRVREDLWGTSDRIGLELISLRIWQLVSDGMVITPAVEEDELLQ